MASVRELLARFSGNAQGLKSQIGSVTRDLRGMRRESENTSKRMGKAFDSTGRSADTFKGKILGLEVGMDDQAKAVESARGELDAQTKAYGENSREAKLAEANLHNQIDKYDQLKLSLHGTRDEFEQFNLEQAVSSSVFTKMSDGIGTVSSQLQTAGAHIKSFGDSWTKYISAPIAAGIGTVATMGVRRAMDIEQVGFMMGQIMPTEEDQQRVMDRTLDLVKGTSFGLAEAANPMANLLMSGFSEDDSAQHLQVGMEMSAFRGDSELLPRVADLFQTAKNLGTIDGTMINQFAYAGIDILQILGNQLEISVDEVREQLRNGEIDIEDGLRLLSEGILNGTEGINGESIAMGGMIEKSGETLAGKWKNFWASISSAGERQVMEHGVFDGLKDALDAGYDFFSNSDELLRPIFEHIGNTLTWLVEKAVATVEWFAKLEPAKQRLIGQFTLLAAVIGPVISIFGRVVTVVGRMLVPFQVLFGWLGQISGRFTVAGTTVAASGKKVGVFARILKPLSILLRALTGPIGWIITGVIALGTAFVTAYKKSDTFRGFIDGLVDKFKGAIKWVKDFGKAIAGIWSGDDWSVDGAIDLLYSLGLSEGQVKFVFDAVERVKSAFESIKETASTAFSAVKDFFIGEFTKIQSWWDKDGEMIKKSIVTTWEFIQDQTQKSFDRISAVVGFAINFVKELFQTFAPIVSGIWSALWPTMIYLVKNAWENIKLIVGIGMDLIMGIISAVSAIIEGDWSRFGEILKDTAKSIWNRVVEYFGNMKDNAIDLANQLTGGAIDKFIEMRDGAVERAKDLALTVIQWLTELPLKGIAKFVELKDGAIKWLTDLVQSGVNKAIEIKDGIIEKITELKDSVVGFFSDIYTSVVDWLTSTRDEASNKAGELRDRVMEPVNELLDKIIPPFQKIYDGIKLRMEQLGGILEYIWTLIKTTLIAIALTIYNSLKDRFLAIYNTLKERVEYTRDIIVQLYQAIRDRVVGIALNLYERLKERFLAIYTYLKQRVEYTRDVVVSIYQNLRDRVVSTVQNLYERVRDWFLNLYNNLKERVNRIRTAITERFNNIRDRVVNTVRNLYERVRDWFMNLYNNLRDRVNAIRTAITDRFNNMRDRVVSTVRNLYERVRDWFSNIYTTIRDKMRDAKNKAVDFAEDLYNGAKDQFENLVSSTKDMMNGIGKWIDNLRSSVVNKATSLGRGIANAAIKGFNSLIGGINTVANKLGYKGPLVDKIPTIQAPRTGGALRGIAAYSTGTDNHVGGPALVGDKGKGNKGFGTREIVQEPGGDPFMVNKPTFIDNLAKGSRVISNRNTEKLMSNIDESKKLRPGVGGPKSWLDNQIKKGVSKFAGTATTGIIRGHKIGTQAKEVWDMRDDPAGLAAKVISDYSSFNLPKAALEIATRGVARLAKPMQDKFKELFDDFGGDVDGSHVLGKRITAHFGRYPAGINFNGGRHYGLDTAHVYDRLLSPVSGKVSRVWNDFGGGKSIQISSPDLTWWFMHMSNIARRVGDMVKVGDHLGTTGNTGNWTTGPHLHTQAMRGGVGNRFAINPLPILRKGASVAKGAAAAVAGYFKGGITNGIPELAWLNEEGFRESIISHNPAHKERSENIWTQTGQMLGFGGNRKDEIKLLREEVAILKEIATNTKDTADNTDEIKHKDSKVSIEEFKKKLNRYEDDRIFGL